MVGSISRAALVCLVLLSTQAKGSCPLEGTWDTGMVQAKYGGSFIRIIQKFDCRGGTLQRVIHARGKMMEAMAEVIDRVGTYTVGAPVGPDGAALAVDIKIVAITRRFLDPSSLTLMRDREHCAPEDAAVLIPFDTTEKYCGDMRFPSAGYLERAVVLLRADQLFWSKFHGEDKLIIQKPGEPLERHATVDMELPYKKVVTTERSI